MTDDEIIKALECCERNKDDCTECPHMISCFKGKDTPFFLPELLNVFIRQKVEIKRLNNCCVGLQNERDAYKDIVNEAVDEAKSEAIKKFAERLKKKTDNPGKAMFDVYEYYGETIDNLVKEMTEQEEKL